MITCFECKHKICRKSQEVKDKCYCPPTFLCCDWSVLEEVYEYYRRRGLEAYILMPEKGKDKDVSKTKL